MTLLPQKPPGVGLRKMLRQEKAQVAPRLETRGDGPFDREDVYTLIEAKTLAEFLSAAEKIYQDLFNKKTNRDPSKREDALCDLIDQITSQVPQFQKLQTADSEAEEIELIQKVKTAFYKHLPNNNFGFDLAEKVHRLWNRERPKLKPQDWDALTTATTLSEITKALEAIDQKITNQEYLPAPDINSFSQKKIRKYLHFLQYVDSIPIPKNEERKAFLDSVRKDSQKHLPHYFDLQNKVVAEYERKLFPFPDTSSGHLAEEIQQHYEKFKPRRVILNPESESGPKERIRNLRKEVFLSILGETKKLADYWHYILHFPQASLNDIQTALENLTELNPLLEAPLRFPDMLKAIQDINKRIAEKKRSGSSMNIDDFKDLLSSISQDNDWRKKMRKAILVAIT